MPCPSSLAAGWHLSLTVTPGHCDTAGCSDWLSLAPPWGGWNRPEPAVSSWGSPPSSQRPLCQLLGSGTWYDLKLYNHTLRCRFKTVCRFVQLFWSFGRQSSGNSGGVLKELQDAENTVQPAHPVWWSKPVQWMYQSEGEISENLQKKNVLISSPWTSKARNNSVMKSWALTLISAKISN